MADEVSNNIEDALNKLVNTTDQSGNTRKELKKTIFETVSTLRNLFNKMKVTLNEKTRQNKQMERVINWVKTELDACRNANTMGQPETSSVRGRELPRTVSRRVLPPEDRNRKLYSKVVAGRTEIKFKLTLRSKVSQPSEPTQNNLEITSLKSLRDGRVMIKASSR